MPLPKHATIPYADDATQRIFALIPCAGAGLRCGPCGAGQPKQFHPLAGQPMVFHTLAAFAGVERVASTLVVLAPNDAVGAGLLEAWCADHPRFAFSACGGATRARTVTQGLEHLLRTEAHAEDWVMVHDAARCLIQPESINTLIDACLSDPVGGLLALPLPDTLKHGRADRVAATLRRQDKWLAQTPQMFRIGKLLDALHHSPDEVTDDAMAIEAMGESPLLVRGSTQNFKVTYPEDLAFAETILRGRTCSVPPPASPSPLTSP